MERIHTKTSLKSAGEAVLAGYVSNKVQRSSLPAASTQDLSLHGFRASGGSGSRPSSSSGRQTYLKRKALSAILTPSMQQIVDQDRIVELRGLKSPPSFEVGGKHGHAVTHSRTPTVHKGWRVVAIDGARVTPAEVGSVLVRARQNTKYTVTFRIGDEDGEDDTRKREEVERKAELERQAAERLRAKAKAELERKAAEVERERQRQIAEEMAAEAERKRAAEEAEKQAWAEREAARVAAEEAERLRAEEAAREAESRRKAAEEEEKRQAAQWEAAQEAKRKAVEEAQRKRQEEEAERQKAAILKAEQERQAAAEAERKRKQEEEEAKQKAAEEAERQRQADLDERRRAEEEMRKAKEIEEEAKKKAVEEAKRKEAEERKRSEEEAKRKADELAKRKAEAESRGKKEAERKAAQEAEMQNKAIVQELQVQRQEVEKHLEKTTGLPPRDTVADPGKALLKALTKAKPKEPPKKLGGPCDKCDGPHHEDDCPHFKKKRDDHKDAWAKYGSKGKGDDGDGLVIIRNARVIPQPGDGSCLFHSLAYGLGQGANATKLRAEIADFVAANPRELVADNPLKDWVLWDSGMDVASYAKTMRTGSRWGGAVEIAVCAKIKGAAVHIYEKQSRGYARISTFGDDTMRNNKIINIHYGGRVHYDAIQL